MPSLPPIGQLELIQNLADNMESPPGGGDPIADGPTIDRLIECLERIWQANL